MIPAASPAPPPPEVARCLEEACASFEVAAGVAPPRELAHSIAGRNVVVRFAGEALIEPLGAALAHHPPARAGAPTLTINAWDLQSTPAPLPRLPVDELELEQWVRRSRLAETVSVAYETTARALSLLDRASATAYFCVADARELPFWERTEPFRALLHWWLSEHGRQLVHASGVGTADDAVLIAGASGSGKSTTALACLAHSDRLGYLGDDHCVVGVDAAPTAFGLYGTAKLEPEQAARLPGLARRAAASAVRLPDGKVLFPVGRELPERMLHCAPLRAIAVPVVVDAVDTTFAPLSAARALAAVAPNTILQLPGAGAGTLETLGRLVRAVPAYRLALGSNLARIPDTVERMIDDAT